MAKITDLDILELRNFFKEALSRAQKADTQIDYEPLGRTNAGCV